MSLNINKFSFFQNALEVPTGTGIEVLFPITAHTCYFWIKANNVAASSKFAILIDGREVSEVLDVPLVATKFNVPVEVPEGSILGIKLLSGSLGYTYVSILGENHDA